MKNFRTDLTRILIGFLGWLVVLVGVVLLPLPGPGWVVIFIGLSILATQYGWAKRLRAWVHRKYDWWRVWIVAQPVYIKLLFWLLTTLTVIILLWLVNAYSVIDTVLKLDKQWFSSPFTRL